MGRRRPRRRTLTNFVEPVLVAERVDRRPSVCGPTRLRGSSSSAAKRWAGLLSSCCCSPLAFFLRYAFENEWIGPLGRVALGIAAGAILSWRGLRYERRGWHVFAQMLLAASIVLIYLSTYSAFAFYHLLSQQLAAIFLIALVAESALVALRMESPAIALMAVIGGLLTPLLMHTQHDQYASLFMYLTALNVGVVLLLAMRRWFVVGTVALLGTQGLFWAWHAENYHPEKLPWAIGFQGVLWLLYFVDSFRPGRLGRRANPEELVRVLVNAALLFGGAYALLREDYRPWMGTLAVSLAFVYALAAQYLFARSRRANADDAPLVLANLTVACGLIALAFPLQAAAPWVALGWAAEAGVLWWFGLRIRNVPLRVMGAVLAAATAVRIFAETPPDYRVPFRLILNDYALPALAAVACLIFALAIGRRLLSREAAGERTAIGLVFVGCILLIWWIVSVDLYQYFMAAPGRLQSLDQGTQQRLAQMSLSAWWAVYASLVLAVGFRIRLSLLRWTAAGAVCLDHCQGVPVRHVGPGPDLSDRSFLRAGFAAWSGRLGLSAATTRPRRR